MPFLKSVFWEDKIEKLVRPTYHFFLENSHVWEPHSYLGVALIWEPLMLRIHSFLVSHSHIWEPLLPLRATHLWEAVSQLGALLFRSHSCLEANQHSHLGATLAFGSQSHFWSHSCIWEPLLGLGAILMFGNHTLISETLMLGSQFHFWEPLLHLGATLTLGNHYHAWKPLPCLGATPTFEGPSHV